MKVDDEILSETNETALLLFLSVPLLHLWVDPQRLHCHVQTEIPKGFLPKPLFFLFLSSLSKVLQMKA